MKAENDAALARLEAVWNPAQVHAIGAVPVSPVTPYAAVSVSSGSAENYRLCGAHGSRSYRIVVQAVGKSISEIGNPIEAADTAFLDTKLAIAGFDTTPAQVEVSSPIIRDPDAGGLLSCTLTYTFAAYPTA